MSYDLTEDEIDLVKSLTPYPKFYPEEFENSLSYLASIKVAAFHNSGWTKGSEHQKAINWIKSLQPPRIKTCKGCSA